MTRLPEDPSLDQAVALLEKAQNLKPNNPQTYLLLGRAYCLQGDFSAAIAAFDEFSRIRKGNPLGAQETAFSHITMTLVPDLVPEEDVSTHETAAEKILQSLSYSFEYFIDEADGAFDRDAHASLVLVSPGGFVPTPARGSCPEGEFPERFVYRLVFAIYPRKTSQNDPFCPGHH